MQMVEEDPDHIAVVGEEKDVDPIGVVGEEEETRVSIFLFVFSFCRMFYLLLVFRFSSTLQSLQARDRQANPGENMLLQQKLSLKKML